MNKLFLLTFLSTYLMAISVSDLAVFNTKETKENKMAKENKKIRCRYVCDKKIYKEQKISDAVSFYKNSKEYKFSAK